jgi:hypothetical protein
MGYLKEKENEEIKGVDEEQLGLIEEQNFPAAAFEAK